MHKMSKYFKLLWHKSIQNKSCLGWIYPSFFSYVPLLIEIIIFKVLSSNKVTKRNYVFYLNSSQIHNIRVLIFVERTM